MKTVFHADHITEAHLVAEILKRVGIRPFVSGGLLQGAMGELPAAGLVTVAVIDDDEEDAIAAIRDQYLQVEPEESTDTAGQSPRSTDGLEPV